MQPAIQYGKCQCHASALRQPGSVFHRLLETLIGLERRIERRQKRHGLLGAQANETLLLIHPKSGSYPAPTSPVGGLNGPITGAMRSLT